MNFHLTLQNKVSSVIISRKVQGPSTEPITFLRLAPSVIQISSNLVYCCEFSTVFPLVDSGEVHPFRHLFTDLQLSSFIYTYNCITSPRNLVLTLSSLFINFTCKETLVTFHCTSTRDRLQKSFFVRPSLCTETTSNKVFVCFEFKTDQVSI